MSGIKKLILSFFLIFAPFLISLPVAYACGGGGLNPPCQVKDSIYSGDTRKNPIVEWIVFGINVLSALVGLGSIIMIIIAGIQYSAAGDNAQSIQSAKKKITNVLIGLAAYISFYAITNWLIPGGLL
jgi:hypothetical protein